MKIKRVRYLKGPNYFNYKPTIWIELDIQELEFRPSNTIPGFSEALLCLIPSLKTHTCSLGYEGGFVERLQEGTWMGHILEHVALELQALAGIEVKRGKTETSQNKGIYYVTYDYEEPKSGFYAFEAAMEIVEKLLKGKHHLSVEPYVNHISDLYYNQKLGPSTEAIYKAAAAKKIPVERVGSDSLLRLGTGSKQKLVQATITSQTSNLAVENACDKQVTKMLLEGCGVPVPPGEKATSIKEIFEVANRIGFPLVVKPLNGRQGQGVMTNIKNNDELLRVMQRMDRQYEEFIVERYYEGNDYRLLVVNYQLVAASLRIPPFVIGNGKDSIRSLIELENKDPRRGDNHGMPMSKIKMDDHVCCYLENQGLTLDSILENGRIVQVVGNANLSTGGQAIDVTDQVHPTIKEIAIASVKAIGLDIAGVDMICKSISEPFNSNDTAIIEVNAAPGIRMHLYPGIGKKRDVGKAIVDYLFSNREEAAIPIVSITGTNGKTTTARLVKYFLEQEGKTVGMTDSDGIYVGNRCIDEGDCSGPISARMVLSNPSVDAAVLETARGGILREGLAFRYCDVGIVTNVSEDHLGQDGIETFDNLVKLKRLIPEVVIEGGSCILNADDQAVAKMADFTKGNVIYTSLQAANPYIQQAIQQKGDAWFVDETGWIILLSDGSASKFLPCAEIPITIEGTAEHNISNLLQALAAAHSLNVPLSCLREKALSFLPDFNLSKGRFNKIDKNGRKLIVDYAHNVAGLHAIYDTIRKLKGKNGNRIITVLSAPGDRVNGEIQNLASVAARNTDLLIIKEDSDLRGRVENEVPVMIRDVAVKEKMETETTIIQNELEAFKKAWELSREGDIVLFVYEEFSNVMEFLRLHCQVDIK